MLVVTISQQFGSGGRLIGKKVAERLSIPYVDQEIVSRAASLADVSEDALADVDERRPTLLTFIGDLLARYPAAAELGMPAVEVEPALSQESFQEMIDDVVRDIAKKGSAVIVGRGGQVILKDDPRAVHFHLYAPVELRVKRVMERDGVSKAEAEKMVRDSDRNRAGYLKTYYKNDWQNPLLYTMMINTAKLEVDAIVDVIVATAKQSAGEP